MSAGAPPPNEGVVKVVLGSRSPLSFNNKEVIRHCEGAEATAAIY